jgi:hypothetical protein
MRTVIPFAEAARRLAARNDEAVGIPEIWTGAERARTQHETSAVRIRVVTERSEFELVEVRRR